MEKSPAPSSFSIPLPSLEATQHVAATLSTAARRGDVITLQGVLGAGKTTFARAFIQALNPKILEVPSPTFTLVHVYDEQPLPIWHFDLYRLKSAEEVYELGIEEAFATALSLIEWPERLAGFSLSNCLSLSFSHHPPSMQRTLHITPDVSWVTRLPEF